MRLYLLRHAKTDQFSLSGKDFDRKLLKKGLLQATELGKYFHENKIDPPFLFCSTAARTRQTLSTIQKEHEFHAQTIFRDDLYLSEKENLLSLLWTQEHTDDILIIGHNDGISEFASYLTDDYIELKTGELIVIEFTADSWKETSKGLGKIGERYRPNI